MFFKKPEYRRFDYKPRYWDPEKEARREREKRIRAELKKEEGEYVPDIKGKLREEFDRRKAARNQINSRYTLRLFMILILLFIAAFYIFIKNQESILSFFGM